MHKYTAWKVSQKPVIHRSLLDFLGQIQDRRGEQGRRFSLAFLISIVLFGFLKGKTSLEGCVAFGLARKKWWRRWFPLFEDIPNATTISRALRVTLPNDIIAAVQSFMIFLEGTIIHRGMSMDGKTIKAISTLKEGCKHFISLFSHNTCRIIDQEGVRAKENEITASPRLIERTCLVGTMITGDAMFTQTRITQAIRESGGDYLLIVKGNHPDLQTIFKPTFTDPQTVLTTHSFSEARHDRAVTTTISVTASLDLDDLRQQGWQDIALVGKLTRMGKRISKRSETEINETVYFITSRADLTPQQAHDFIRQHWHIENKLHWQKDVTWNEDRSRAHKGNLSAILSYLRSFALQCIRQQYESVTEAITNTFTERPEKYLALLTKLQLVWAKGQKE